MVKRSARFALESQLNITISRWELFEQAFTHRSCSTHKHNERLEFLGDSVLNASVSYALFERYPKVSEGDLSRARASLVNTGSLAALTKTYGWVQWIRVGLGESNLSQKPALLADLFEAVVGAVFVDQGWLAADFFVRQAFAQKIEEVIFAHTQDAKTALQEWAQKKGSSLPDYQLTATKGLAHALEFEVSCFLRGFNAPMKAKAKTKKEAEQKAAALWLSALTSGDQDVR